MDYRNRDVDLEDVRIPDEDVFARSSLPKKEECKGTSLELCYVDTRESNRGDYEAKHVVIAEITGVHVVDDVITLGISMDLDEDNDMIDCLRFCDDEWHIRIADSDFTVAEMKTLSIGGAKAPASQDFTPSLRYNPPAPEPPKMAPMPEPVAAPVQVPVVLARPIASDGELTPGTIMRREQVPAGVIVMPYGQSSSTPKYFRGNGDGTFDSMTVKPEAPNGWEQASYNQSIGGTVKDLVVVVEVLPED